MNKDKIKGAVKDAAGKVQEQVGKVIGSKSQRTKGAQKQVDSKAQKLRGDVKETVADAKEANMENSKRH